MAIGGGQSRVEYDYQDFDLQNVSQDFWVKPSSVNSAPSNCAGDACNIYTDLAGLHTANPWGSLIALDGSGQLMWKQPMRNNATPNVCSNDTSTICTTDLDCVDGVCEASILPELPNWSPTQCSDLTTNFVPVLNQWTHIVATYDGSQIKLYANGQPEGPGLVLLMTRLPKRFSLDPSMLKMALRPYTTKSGFMSEP